MNRMFDTNILLEQMEYYLDYHKRAASKRVYDEKIVFSLPLFSVAYIMFAITIVFTEDTVTASISKELDTSEYYIHFLDEDYVPDAAYTYTIFDAGQGIECNDMAIPFMHLLAKADEMYYDYSDFGS